MTKTIEEELQSLINKVRHVLGKIHDNPYKRIALTCLRYAEDVLYEHAPSASRLVHMAIQLRAEALAFEDRIENSMGGRYPGLPRYPGKSPLNPWEKIIDETGK